MSLFFKLIRVINIEIQPYASLIAFVMLIVHGIKAVVSLSELNYEDGGSLLRCADTLNIEQETF